MNDCIFMLFFSFLDLKILVCLEFFSLNLELKDVSNYDSNLLMNINDPFIFVSFLIFDYIIRYLIYYNYSDLAEFCLNLITNFLTNFYPENNLIIFTIYK